MGTQVTPRKRRRGRSVTILLVAAVMALTMVSAAAADLGGIRSATVGAWSTDVVVEVPTAIADDDFVGCNANLAGWTDSLGNAWVDHWGGWQCLGGELVRSRWRLPLAHASVDLGISDGIVITTTLERISTQGGRSGPGIALFTDGFFHMYAIYERDQGLVTLGQWAPWQNSALASVPISDRQTAEISVVVNQPDIMVLVNGIEVIAYTMTQQQLDQFGSNTRFGLESDRDNWSRFDTFRVEILS